MSLGILHRFRTYGTEGRFLLFLQSFTPYGGEKCAVRCKIFVENIITNEKRAVRYATSSVFKLTAKDILMSRLLPTSN
jgi:hypothetical protein